MDPDFVREIVVLLGFIALYLVGSMLMVRGHKTDLSAVTHGGGPSGGGGGDLGSPRLNRRRKALAREAADRADRQSADVAE